MTNKLEESRNAAFGELGFSDKAIELCHRKVNVGVIENS